MYNELRDIGSVESQKLKQSLGWDSKPAVMGGRFGNRSTRALSGSELIYLVNFNYIAFCFQSLFENSV